MGKILKQNLQNIFTISKEIKFIEKSHLKKNTGFLKNLKMPRRQKNSFKILFWKMGLPISEGTKQIFILQTGDCYDENATL